MDIKEIYIKNFRNIGEEGAEIKLSPITIFTGCNNAGKSTAAKALLLLEAYLSDVKANNYDLIDTPLDFSKVVKLGTFDSVLNNASKNNGQEDIILGYSFASAILLADIHVRFVFGKRDTDILKNGWLKAFLILIGSTELLSVSIVNGFYSFEIKDKEKFIEYIRCYKIHHLISSWKSYEMDCRVKAYLNNVQNFKKDEDMEKIRLLIPKLVEINDDLISKRVICKDLYIKDEDQAITQKPTMANIISVIEGIIELQSWWVNGIKLEKINNKRLSKDDIGILLEDIYKDVCYRIDSKQKQSEDFPKLWERKSEIIGNNLQVYIDSESQSIIEYKREQNNSIIGIFVNSLNVKEDQTEFSCSKDEKKKGILDLIQFVSETNSDSDWIGMVFKYVLKRCLTPSVIDKTGYVDASTMQVKRLYPLDSSDRFGNLWQRFNDMKPRIHLTQSDKFERGAFIHKWLREFNICEDLIVENVEGTIRIKLISKENPEGRLLADYGYGVTQLIALLLNVEIALNNVEFKIGGSEEIGDVVDLNIDYIPSLLILEEPEVHLHPSLQSRLADMFLDAEKYGVHFIIETHSEYLVRRSQVIVAEMNLDEKELEKRNPFRVYYFPESRSPYDMNYLSSGRFLNKFGQGFLDEASKWHLQILKMGKEK